MGHSTIHGYTYRRCPYSLWYKTNYYDEGYDGNSTNANLPIPDGQITEHTTTSGCMIIHHKGGVYGFMCWDDECYYYITNGRRYFEI